MLSGISANVYLTSYMSAVRTVQNENEVQDAFSSLLGREAESFPYASKAKDGMVEYNGVAFVGDAESNSLCLGDMTNKNRVLNIQLSGGGFLKVNYDNIGDLKDAIGMFSGRDKGIILQAISTYHFEQGFIKAAEDEEEEEVEDLSKSSSISDDGVEDVEETEDSDAKTAMNIMNQSGFSFRDKIINSHKRTIQVGPSKMAVPKWDGEKEAV